MQNWILKDEMLLGLKEQSDANMIFGLWNVSWYEEHRDERCKLTCVFSYYWLADKNLPHITCRVPDVFIKQNEHQVVKLWPALHLLVNVIHDRHLTEVFVGECITRQKWSYKSVYWWIYYTTEMILPKCLLVNILHDRNDLLQKCLLVNISHDRHDLTQVSIGEYITW